MTKLHHIPNETAMDNYRSRLTGERLGWAIFSHPSSYSPVHHIHMDPQAGPVIIVYDEVYEVDPDIDQVYATEDIARDKYWEEKART